MSKQILEYVWIDGNDELRSKINVVTINKPDNYITINEIEKCELWNFDGSSTNQPSTNSHISDIILRPVRLYNNIFFKNALFVFCECVNTDTSPHISNYRQKCKETDKKYSAYECLFGIEQEYMIFERNGKQYNLDIINIENKNKYIYPNYQQQQQQQQQVALNPHYCSVGGDRSFGRCISNEHLQCCIEANIDICGTNSEVTQSQWEYQIGICDATKVGDDLYMSRYLLHRISEKYNCYVSFSPKPIPNLNGSGGHTNFSTKKMREPNGLKYIYEACERLKETHETHVKSKGYGLDNNLRLTGLNETSSIHIFSYETGNRSCSVRIPLQVELNKCGYLEDRRPAANLNPYIVTELLMNSILFCSE